MKAQEIGAPTLTSEQMKKHEEGFKRIGGCRAIGEIQLQIHRLLIEATAIADENNQVLETDIRTMYLNSTGHIGANAVLECNLILLEK